MMQKSGNIPIIALSTDVYRVLLFAYPAGFRREYGAQMRQVFRDCCLRALTQNGGIGMLELWAITLFDFARSLVEEHTQKETTMKNSNLIRLSGWAFIAGAITFIAILSGTDPVSIPASVISAILLAVGLLGLRARYGERAGSFGRSILLIGVIGMPLPYLAIALFAVAAAVLPLTPIQVENAFSAGLWVLLFGGPAIVLLALTLFGVAALRRKPMPRMNWLPVVAGIWYPAIYFGFSGYLISHGGDYSGEYQTAIILGLLVQFFALCGLGAILLSEPSQETAMA
jgi:hypothetical protein